MPDIEPDYDSQRLASELAALSDGTDTVSDPATFSAATGERRHTSHRMGRQCFGSPVDRQPTSRRGQAHRTDYIPNEAERRYAVQRRERIGTRENGFPFTVRFTTTPGASRRPCTQAYSRGSSHRRVPANAIARLTWRTFSHVASDSVRALPSADRSLTLVLRG